MLKIEIEQALNDQIVKEAFASISYLSMAGWCETGGLSGAGEFFYAQSAEERQHMLKLFRYVNASGGHAMTPETKRPLIEYDSLHHAVAVSLKQETEVTKSIHELTDLTLRVKDFGTFNFLQWFITEQQEEERVFKSIEDMLRLAGGKDANLLIVDNEIRQFKSKEK